MRPVSATLALFCACLLAACASDRLNSSPPQGVNLAGEWNFNPNLSDDPNKPGTPDTSDQPKPSGSHRGRAGGRGGGGGGGMGIPPNASATGGGYNFLLVAQTAAVPRVTKAPTHLSIEQEGSHLIFRTNMTDGSQTVDDYVAGFSGKIPYMDSTAKRSVGWSGPVFVITTDAGKIGWREDQFALDEDGRLIMTTTTKGGRMGNGDIKRVYDRARGAAAAT
jgi:hypothetical protein